MKPGERLQWRTDLPLIVLGRGMPTPRKARDGSNSHDEPNDRRAVCGVGSHLESVSGGSREPVNAWEFRLAEKSGHFIQRDQPELVIQAIRDVSRSH